MKSEAHLSKIVNRATVPWSRHAKTVRYKAALIVRNVRYGQWDLREVELFLGIWLGIGRKKQRSAVTSEKT